MRNEDQVEQLLERSGFEIVYPETLGFQDQIRTFAKAECIVGPSGSGMFNAALAPAGCRVLDVETFTYTVAQHGMLYASCGHPYAFLFATPEMEPNTPVVHQGYTVSPTKLLTALDWALA